jgi:membrane protein YqaA with SNARE-associated domain
MVLAKPSDWYKLAGLCTISSVIGGFLGYAIGYFAMDTVGQWLLGLMGLNEKFESLKPWIAEYGVWLIVLKGMTPIPYKLITITAGAFKFDLLLFTVASIVARGMRFYLSAILLWRFGEPVRQFIEKRLALVTSAVAFLLVGGFLALKLL